MGRMGWGWGGGGLECVQMAEEGFTGPSMREKHVELALLDDSQLLHHHRFHLT